MTRFILRLLITALSLWVAARLVPGIDYRGGWLGLAALALIFGLVNATLGTVLKLLSCPLIVLTLGLFTLAINAALLMLSAGVGNMLGIAFEVEGCMAALLGAVVIALVSVVANLLLPDVDDGRSERA